MPQPATPALSPAAPATPASGVLTCAEGTPAARAEALPERIGRYRVVALLGQGGQGSVYRALDPDLGREVVLKWCHRVLDDAGRERLRAEGRVLASLSH